MVQPNYTRGKTVDQSKYQHLPIEVQSSVSDLKSLVFSHPAVETLKAFGKKLSQRPLSPAEMKILLASEGMFVLEVPPGVLSLASRITDENFPSKPFSATGLAARVLFAAVDEYGLNDMDHGLLPSHHQLYLDMATHFGMTEQELRDKRYIVPAAYDFAKVINNFYRKQPIVEALGFHVANEATALLDFGVILKSFKRHRAEYGLKADNDPHLNFLLVHEDVEVSHREAGVEMVQLYTQGEPELVECARTGVLAYMECYGRLFEQIDDAIFGANSQVNRIAS